jgi:hypothetical protein
MLARFIQWRVKRVDARIIKDPLQQRPTLRRWIDRPKIPKQNSLSSSPLKANLSSLLIELAIWRCHSGNPAMGMALGLRSNTAKNYPELFFRSGQHSCA